MAQFVPQNKVLVGQQPQVVGSQVLQQQPVLVQQVPQPVVFQSQQPIQVQQQRQYGEHDTLLRKEDKKALLFKKVLFYGPCLFFFLLLVFSTTMYILRFHHANGTQDQAIDTLGNFGDSLTQNPIVEIVLLPKNKKGTTDKSDCSQVHGTAVENKGLFKEHVFENFATIHSGCVCTEKKYNQNVLTYHDLDYCDENLSNCKEVNHREETQNKYLLDNLWCVLRVSEFEWRRQGDKSLCSSKVDSLGQKMINCGSELCVSRGKYPAAKQLCPLTSVNIRTKCARGETATASGFVQTKNNANQIKNQRLCVTRGVSGQTAGNQAVLQLLTSISNPRCLAQNVQRPFRATKQFYRLQNPRENGCYPYGSHVQSSSPTVKATYNPGYLGVLTQVDDNKFNGVDTSSIPYYDQYVIDNAQDYVNLYSETRPVVSNSDECRDVNIEEVAQKSRDTVHILNTVEVWTLVFLILAAVGLFLSLLFIVLRLKNFVNSTTQLYLHIFAFIVALMFFVYAIVFWIRMSRYQTFEITDELKQQETHNCYKYQGQKLASRHLHELTETIANPINGITIFLFVVTVIYMLAVLVGSFYRKSKALVVCEPLKGDNYYYEN